MIKSAYLKYKAKLQKALYIFRYFLFRHRKIIAGLSSCGLANISIYRINRWYMEHGEAKILRYYYKAELNGEKCFVKIAKNDSTINREIFVNNYITQYGFNFIPKTLMSNENYDKDMALLVTEFINGQLRDFEIPRDETVFESVCAEFEYIHSCLREADVIHGDIIYSNVLLDKANHLRLIDFGIVWTPGSECYPIEYHHKGNNYISSESTRIYDNAYAFLRMLEQCGVSEGYKQKECYKRIERLIGVHTHTVWLPTANLQGEYN